MFRRDRQSYSSNKGGRYSGLNVLNCGHAIVPCTLKPIHTSREYLFSMSSQEISVNIPPTLDPVYSNMIQIAYKDDEFTLLFLHQLPQVNQARAKAIVSITPSHAKNLLAVLTKTVTDYEAKFGTIAHKETTGKENVTALSGYS